MRRFGVLLAMLVLALSVYADKLPKGVEKARQSVASIVTYKRGVVLHSGTAVFIDEAGDALSSYSLFVPARCRKVKGNA